MKKNKNNNMALENSSKATKENEYKPLVKKSKRRNELLSNKEASIIRKQNRKLIKWIAIVGVVVLSIILISCTIDIFEFFYKINKYLGYGSLALILILVLIFVIRPIIVALSTPCFTLDIINEDRKNITKINYQKLKKVASNLLDSEDISEESKERIKASINKKNDLNNTLRDIYDKEISSKINKIVNDSALKVLLSTAISQNDKYDALTVGLVNIRMIMKIVIACGYHPTYPQLYKLIAKVFRNALIAYTLESSKIDELIFNGLNKLAKGVLSYIPLVSEVTKSVTQGSANALLTLRIGIITRKYLYEEFDIQAMIDEPETLSTEILEEAVIEANSKIDNLIKEANEKNVAK